MTIEKDLENRVLPKVVYDWLLEGSHTIKLDDGTILVRYDEFLGQKLDTPMIVKAFDPHPIGRRDVEINEI